MPNDIVRNSRFEGLGELGDRREFCPGWSLRCPGPEETRRLAIEAIGEAEERRVLVAVHEAARWVRLMQRIEPADGVTGIECTLTLGRAEGSSLGARVSRVAVLRTTEDGSETLHADIERFLDAPEYPETQRFIVPCQPMDLDGTYWLAVELDPGNAIELWNIGLTWTDGARDVPLGGGGTSEEGSGYFVALDGANADRVRGWCASKRDPDALFDVRVLVDGLPLCTARNCRERRDLAAKGITGGAGGIEVDFPDGLFRHGPKEIVLVAPDGGRSAPLTVAAQAPKRKGVQVFVPPRRTRGENDVAVIVPVYGAFEELRECIDALRAHTPDSTLWVFVDDASPDPRIAPLLSRLERDRDNVRFLKNAQNIGFSATINRGIEAAGRRDCVLLNSDARVTPGWLESMVDAADHRPRIASVTPLSDNAGAFSAPVIGTYNALPPGVTEAEAAIAIRRHSDRTRPTVPTGNGFCMYVARAALDEIGPFDAEAFPKGYGEENDWCMRAVRAGWTHVVDDACYVFHERSASFGSSKEELAKRGREVVDERYPEYRKLTPAFSSDAVRLARFRVAEALGRIGPREPVLPRALFVYSTRTGGTPQTNRDLMAELAESFDTWTLRCDSHALYLERFRDGRSTEVCTHRLAESIGPIGHRSLEYDRVVADWLTRHDFSLVHVRHLAWHSLSLPSIAAGAGIPVVLSFHDFYTVCPTTNLIDAEDNYCAGRCTRGEGDCPQPLWPPGSLPRLRNGWVHEWRRRFSEAFEHCSAFVTTSPSVRATIVAAFPELAGRIQIIPHGRTLRMTVAASSPPVAEEPLRILLPGNIGRTKGLGVIRHLAELDGGRQLEFHVLGTMHETLPGVICHGPYEREAIVERINGIAPSVAAVFSVCDETWCHTLTEVWSAGLPAIVFDFGTVARRVRESGGGWVLPHDDVDRLHHDLVHVVKDPQEYDARRAAVLRWQRGLGAARTSAHMAAAYLDLYNRLPSRDGRGALPLESADVPSIGTGSARAAPEMRVAVVCPGDGDLRTAPASTHIRMWSRTRPLVGRTPVYTRYTPSQLIAAVEIGEVRHAFVQRNALPPSVADRLVELVRADRVRVAVDLDDDLLAVPADKDPGGRYRRESDALRSLLRAADLVTVSTPAMRSRYESIARRVELLPNRLDARLWGPVDGRRFNRSADRFVMMYMGSRTHDADLALLLDGFERAARRVPDIHLKIVGGFAVPPERLSARVEIVEVPGPARSYPEFVRHLERVSKDVDLAVCPLLDDPFNRFKSGLKFLEYAGLGLSGLYSDRDEYRALARESGVGTLVADDASSWADAMVRAVRERERLHAEGERARDWVMSTHAMQPTLEEFDALVRSLCDERSAKRPAGTVVPLDREATVR